MHLLSEIPPDGRILEIGCGTGKATLPFAQRGYAIVIFVDDAPHLPKWATCKKLLTNQKSYAMMVTMPETFPVSLPQPSAWYLAQSCNPLETSRAEA